MGLKGAPHRRRDPRLIFPGLDDMHRDDLRAVRLVPDRSPVDPAGAAVDAWLAWRRAHLLTKGRIGHEEAGVMTIESRTQEPPGTVHR